MITTQAHASQALPIGKRWDDLQFRLIFALGFVFFLIGAVVMRLMPNHWRDQPHRSVIAQAWEASGTIAQIAFSG